ncbi:MAG: DMT family transporter [Rhizobiales bacterium]|nr:DMT family transporter [Hyphomicrobiales bacterium]MBN8984876.1 DMT family transporter [Hyphomicrobiales bacterium]
MTETPPSSTERPLDTSAIALVLLLCLTWGFNQVVVKLLLPEIPPLTQAFLRSLGGLAVILVVARVRRVKLLTRDGTLRAGLWAGSLFGIEFIFLYSGLLWTTASRASVFLYTAPFFVAFGSYRYLGERMGRLQWAGLALSFVGVAVAIGVPQPNVDAKVMLGDVFMIAAGSLWAATTLIVKASRLRNAPAEKGLAYQLVVSLPILGIGALIGGETMSRLPGTTSSLLMVYQAVWVVGATFLLWFGMIKTYSASKLSAFTFVTPLFGVAAGYFILNEPLTAAFGVAAVLVTAGLYLVNRPAPYATDPLLKLPKT